MGSMISRTHLAKVDGYIQKGIDEGASMLHGEFQIVVKRFFC